jgi:hypothetical protein
MREALTLPAASIHRSLLTFTHQQNGNDGEKRVFVRNHQNPKLCFVALMLRIVKQFIHLVGWESASTPLAIYQSSASACAPRQNFSLDLSPGHRPGTDSVPTDEAKAKSHRLLETLLVN